MANNLDAHNDRMVRRWLRKKVIASTDRMIADLKTKPQPHEGGRHG